MNTLGRMSILLVSALLTGCAGCPGPGQPSGTKIGPDPAWSWLQDKSTCDCHYLFLIPDPVNDVQPVDAQTSMVRAMVPPAPANLDQPNLRAINTRYSFLVNSSEASLEALATKAGKYGLKFEGCRVPNANTDDGEEFVLNVKENNAGRSLLRVRER